MKTVLQATQVLPDCGQAQKAGTLQGDSVKFTTCMITAALAPSVLLPQHACMHGSTGCCTWRPAGSLAAQAHVSWNLNARLWPKTKTLAHQVEARSAGPACGGLGGAQGAQLLLGGGAAPGQCCGAVAHGVAAAVGDSGAGGAAASRLRSRPGSRGGGWGWHWAQCPCKRMHIWGPVGQGWQASRGGSDSFRDLCLFLLACTTTSAHPIVAHGAAHAAGKPGGARRAQLGGCQARARLRAALPIRVSPAIGGQAGGAGGAGG